jgi:hypothetical protein
VHRDLCNPWPERPADCQSFCDHSVGLPLLARAGSRFKPSR